MIIVQSENSIAVTLLYLSNHVTVFPVDTSCFYVSLLLKERNKSQTGYKEPQANQLQNNQGLPRSIQRNWEIAHLWLLISFMPTFALPTPSHSSQQFIPFTPACTCFCPAVPCSVQHTLRLSLSLDVLANEQAIIS